MIAGKCPSCPNPSKRPNNYDRLPIPSLPRTCDFLLVRKLPIGERGRFVGSNTFK